MSGGRGFLHRFFIGSVRETRGRWYRDLANGGPATLEELPTGLPGVPRPPADRR